MLLAISIIGGGLGFVLIEGYGLLDGFYMAIITLSTVGFGEIHPLSQAGRLFSSILILFNTVVAAYVLAVFSYYVIEGKIFRAMQASNIRSQIDQLKDHVIICGFGKYGQEVAEHLQNHRQAYVVIDENEEMLKQLAEHQRDLLYVVGDANEDETLLAAGIRRAKGLITALVDDGDNMFITLSARELQPQLRIVSRAQQVRSELKLKKAGADHVVMPERMGGFYMATLMSKPQAVEFFSFISTEVNADIGFEAIHFEDLSIEQRGKALRELDYRSETGINIIGHHRLDGSYEVNPGPDTILMAGESYIALGSSPQLASLKQLLNRV